MIPFIPAIILAKLFYDLAAKFGKNAWFYAILAAFLFVVSEFLFGFVYILVIWNYQLSENPLALSILAITFGVLVDYLLYKYLKKKWENK
ncbi:MAG: hypothetical protein IT221_11565 [Fluviicola sp.]|nr:hypothetical protein [Fluviicola sp.]